MDDGRLDSPPAIQVEGYHQPYGAHFSSSRRSSLSSSTSRSYSQSAMPMSIPRAKVDSVPPPLPPPRYVEDLAMGQDLGWQMGNTSRKQFGKTDGDPSPWGWNRPSPDERYSEPFGTPRRLSSISTNLHDHDRFEYPVKDEGYHSLSGTSITSKLHGEKRLGRQNRQDSSHAYDKKLLNKIGKPRTPPGSAAADSAEASPIAHGFYPMDKQQQQVKTSSLSDRSFSTSSDSPLKVGSPFNGKWLNSPQSAVLSPSLISSAASAKSFMDYRSPTLSNINAPLSATDSERYARLRQAGGRSNSNGSIWGSSLLDEGGPSASGRSKRDGSCDQAIFTTESDLDLNSPTEETGRMRQLHLDDRTSTVDVHSPRSQSGMKRRATSPPPDPACDDKAPLRSTAAGASSSELHQRRTPGNHHLAANRASPVHRYPLHHPSIPSATSSTTGQPNGSYPPSAGLSIGGSSSITSVSSHDRLSPGRVSPSSERQQQQHLPSPHHQHPHHHLHDAHQITYMDTENLEPSLRGLTTVPHRVHVNVLSDHKSAAALARNMATASSAKANKPQLQANDHICGCCPKKPKKFDTLEELRHHQSEKQYKCQWCHNRFKNKNEAERHQNSLHLRRHSWSCAKLDRDYQAAFHPCTAIPQNTSVNHAPTPPPGALAPSDVCGYCGEEFSNFPAPDWEARINHLTQVHKFGECNQSKKFFRADHFRQHLKHSHAGTSGKWTNMLENSCMKDEPPLTPEALDQEQLRRQQQETQEHIQQHLQGAPVANMMGGGGPGIRHGGFGSMAMGIAGVGELQPHTIDEEMHDEMR